MAVSTTLTVTLRSDKGEYLNPLYALTSLELDTNWTSIKTFVEDVAALANGNETTIGGVSVTVGNNASAISNNVSAITNNAVALLLKEDLKSVVQLTVSDSPYSANWGDSIECDCTGGIVVVNLPTAINNGAKSIEIIKTDATLNDVDINGNESQLINGQANFLVKNEYENVRIVSNGTNNYIR